MLLELTGWIFFSFGVLRLGVSAVNKFSHPYLKSRPSSPDREYGDSVKDLSVLIPARNEERNIEFLLKDLLGSGDDFREVIVYDDRSEDGTAEAVRRLAEMDSRVVLVEGEKEPPEGWLGKNHACFILARKAAGSKLLFLDADVRINRGTLGKAVYTMDSQRVSLLSLFPRQYMPSFGTRLAVPLMNWILLSLLPLPAVRKMPQPSLAAANGQFMLFDSAVYRQLQPHNRFRSSAVEDMAIVNFYKSEGFAVSTLLGNRDVNCRMYTTLSEAITGFAKNVFRFFGGHAWVAFGFAAITTLAPFWIFIFNGWSAGTIYVSVILLIRIFVSCASRQSAAYNIMLLIPQQAVFWIILLRAYRARKNRELKWKGRNIYS